MEKLNTLISTCVPLNVENIDTDQIIPARFLKAVDRKGFGENLFRDWRYDDQGKPKRDFILNNNIYEGKILLAGKNFGCGSSREHAAWALYDYGFRAVVSSYFADIFKGNALNNGLLPVQVSEEFLKKLLGYVKNDPETKLKIDLVNEEISLPELKISEDFGINEFKKNCLLKGYSEIDFLIENLKEIEDYEKESLYHLN